MAKDMGMFQHRTLGDEGFELNLGHEMVMLAIHLARARGAGCGRDRKA